MIVHSSEFFRNFKQRESSVSSLPTPTTATYATILEVTKRFYNFYSSKINCGNCTRCKVQYNRKIGTSIERTQYIDRVAFKMAFVNASSCFAYMAKCRNEREGGWEAQAGRIFHSFAVRLKKY